MFLLLFHIVFTFTSTIERSESGRRDNARGQQQGRGCKFFTGKDNLKLDKIIRHQLLGKTKQISGQGFQILFTITVISTSKISFVYIFTGLKPSCRTDSQAETDGCYIAGD